MEETIKTLASKKYLPIVTDDFHSEIASAREYILKVKYELSKEIRNSVKWMLFFAIANVVATFVIFYLFLKK